jgi:aspartate beta-hydroxylase
MIAQQIGQNPMAQQINSAIQAHLAEHLAFLYRRKIEEQLGVRLPPPTEKLPEQIEVQLSRLVAQASVQLQQLNMAKAQQQEAQEQAQNPVVQMQQAVYSEAAAAFEAALRLEATHRGALINGIHCLQLLPPADRKGRERLEKMAHLGVAAGLWRHPMQRPPHLVPQLASKPWHDRADFPWCSLLESQFAAIRAEVEALRSSQQQLFMSVGGRAAHDHTLVAAGKWTEFPLFGNGTKYTENCARCPVTAAIMERIAPAMELAFAGGGETLFSTLNPGTHLRPHCGSSNTRLTAHLGILVPSGCSIRAGNEWREWREGECLVFDDSWEHEVRHLGDRDRVVLLINFWHPDLLPHERRIDTNTFGYEPI